MIHQLFEIQSTTFLSTDNKKLLREFNDKYDEWIYCGENEVSFMECQNKLICILRFILNTLQNSKGFVEMCKIEPPIKLRSYPSNETRESYETLELREMLHYCIEDPQEAIDMDEFEINDSQHDIIMEKNNEINCLQNQITEYQDVCWIYPDDDVINN